MMATKEYGKLVEIFGTGTPSDPSSMVSAANIAARGFTYQQLQGLVPTYCTQLTTLIGIAPHLIPAPAYPAPPNAPVGGHVIGAAPPMSVHGGAAPNVPLTTPFLHAPTGGPTGIAFSHAPPGGTSGMAFSNTPTGTLQSQTHASTVAPQPLTFPLQNGVPQPFTHVTHAPTVAPQPLTFPLQNGVPQPFTHAPTVAPQPLPFPPQNGVPQPFPANQFQTSTSTSTSISIPDGPTRTASPNLLNDGSSASFASMDMDMVIDTDPDIHNSFLSFLRDSHEFM